MFVGGFPPAQHKCRDDAHHGAKDKNPESIPGISDIQSPEQLTVEFVEEGAKETHQKDLEEANSSNNSSHTDNHGKATSNSIGEGGTWQLEGGLPIYSGVREGDFVVALGAEVGVAFGVVDACFVPECSEEEEVLDGEDKD